MKRLIFIIPLFFISIIFLGWGKVANKLHPSKKENIHWLTITEAVELNKIKPKKIYIDVYTNWCGWCKKMDWESFTNLKVIEEMNADYYAVKLNAESRDSINFAKHTFKYLPEYKANEFAVALLAGKMAYPTTIIMDRDQKIITRIPSYLEANQLKEILIYFGKDINLKSTWNQYQKSMGKDTTAH